uniref:RRM domain-containing protein n=1 Tax=Sphaeramia orbicularis TaxID=375764 RepID=A0A673C8W4_9TELE
MEDSTQPGPKRPRIEEESVPEQPEDRDRDRWKRSGGKPQDAVDSSHQIPPSLVVHVRGLCDAVVEADLVEALSKFGNICYVMMMPFKHQALVEFNSVEGATCCVSCGNREGVVIAEQRAFFNFSTSQRISRPTNADDPSSGNNVLLLSIQNPLYPITTDVLHAVCNPVGNVLRIVIFKHNGVQAMSVTDAQKVKLALNGADIYAGCCTLKIEYARPSKLNVTRNTSTSWDYTQPFPMHRDRAKGRQRQGILGDRPSDGYGPHCPLLPLPMNSSYRRSSEEVQHLSNTSTSSSSSFRNPTPSSSVAIVSGLHPAKMNCSRIFNLFCLYGNVEKVKFMRSVPGTALVEMGDGFAVDRVVTHLNGIKVFGKNLNVCVSKQLAVIPGHATELDDGSSSYKDFTLTRNNRFGGVMSIRNIIQPPTAILHFYNVPPTFSEKQLHQVSKSKLFDAKPGSKTLSGLLQFDGKSEAVEVVTVLNHHQIRTDGKQTEVLDQHMQVFLPDL